MIASPSGRAPEAIYGVRRRDENRGRPTRGGRRGVSLAKLISAKPRTDAVTTTSRRFAAANQILPKMPAQSPGTPPV
jgi:hypothetical protein